MNMGDSTYHDVTLQRLDVSIPEPSGDVFFSRTAFQNTPDWKKIPVVYLDKSAKTARHPTPEEINNQKLPESMRFCGYVDSADIPKEGQARLNGRLIITDPEVESLAKSGALGLSTGIVGDTIVDDTGEKRLTGTITPNHVLVFEQGVRPGFFPRDNGALFLNMRSEDDIMTDTEETDTKTRTLFEKLFASKIEGMKTEILGQMQNELESVKKENEKLNQLVGEKDARIKELESASETLKKDQAWNQIKGECPKGWLGEKEAETRNLYETDKDAFYAKLLNHTQTFGQLKTAEGMITPESLEMEKQMELNIKEARKSLGFEVD